MCSLSGMSGKSDKGDKMGVMDFPDEMQESPDMDIRDGLAEMAQNDLDLPYQAFRKALVNAGIATDMEEEVLIALRVQIARYQENQVEYCKKVYNS